MSHSDCAKYRELLRELPRGTLSPEERRKIEGHLRDCPECKAFEIAEMDLDDALARLPRHRAPVALRHNLVNSLAAAPQKRRVSWRPIAAGVTLLLGLLVLVLRLAIQNPDPIVTEAVNDHLRVLYAQSPIEIASGGIHQVKPWFEGRLDFAPVVQFEGDDEFLLAGGSVGYFIDRKAAVFLFKRRLHWVSVFVFRAEGLPFTRWSEFVPTKLGPQRGRDRGFNVLSYRVDDLGYVLVSDIDAAALDRLGSKLVTRR